MAERAGPPPAGPWLRALRYATESPDAAQALTGVLTEAVGAIGCAAGAVLELSPVAARAVWGCDLETIERVSGEAGAVGAVLAEVAEGGDAVVLPNGDAGEGDWLEGYGHALIVPLCLWSVPTGALVLLYDEPEAPPADHRGRAAGFAGLLALLLENERLYEEAREARQARDHFLTALNHEMRTPAAAFILTVDLLRSELQEHLPPRVERLLHEAEGHVSLMVEILRRVLDLGSLGVRAQSERSDMVLPRHAVAELMRRLEPIAQRKALALALYVPSNLGPIQTDATRFSRIMLHLLSNAIKYTAEGRVEVRIERTTQRLSSGRPEPVIAFHVKDTGRGIPPAELERIFEPFTQVEEGSRADTRSRGSGLGLPLARQLARTLGGDVQVRSEAGSGTVATLVLPYLQASSL